MLVNGHLNASLLSFWPFLFVVGRLFYTFVTGLGSAPYLITRPVFVVPVINTVLLSVINVLDPVIGVVRIAVLTHLFGFRCVRVPFLLSFPVVLSARKECWMDLLVHIMASVCRDFARVFSLF